MPLLSLPIFTFALECLRTLCQLNVKAMTHKRVLFQDLPFKVYEEMSLLYPKQVSALE